MVGRQRASTLSNQVGVGYVVLVGSLYEGVDTVVDILLDGVVDTTLRGRRPRAVVVDAQATATVDEIDVVAHLVQLDIEL